MTAYGICFKQELVLPREIDLRAAQRILGISAGDETALGLLHEQGKDILQSAAPCAVTGEYLLSDALVSGQLDGKPLLSGEDVMAHLAGCKGCVLLGVTLGTRTDAAIRRAALFDVASGAAADALAGALTEQLAEQAEQRLRAAYAERKLFLTGRFSPGYGDWPLSTQQKIARLLQLPKTIGVTVTQSSLMLPRKSVTAILGVADVPVTGKLAGCAHCALQGQCQYRKKGTTCFENDGTV